MAKQERVMKHWLYLIYILVVALSAGGCQKKDNRASEGRTLPQSVDTIPMMIMQIQKCSRLYTAEYKIHKIVTYNDVKRLKGSVLSHDFDIKLPLGDRKIAIPMDAKLKAYIDFSKFSDKNIRREGRKIIVTLPDPKVLLTSSKIDQRNIKEYVDLTRSRFSDAEITEFEQQGRASVIASIPRLGILETARDGAARVIVPMIVQMGYDERDIVVEFRKEYGEKDINMLLDKNEHGR